MGEYELPAAEVSVQSGVIVKSERQQLLDEINEIKRQIRIRERNPQFIGWEKRGEMAGGKNQKLVRLKDQLRDLEDRYNRLLQKNDNTSQGNSNITEIFNGGFNPNAPLDNEDKITLKDIDTIKEKEILNNEYENVKQGLIDIGAGEKIIYNNLDMIS